MALPADIASTTNNNNTINKFVSLFDKGIVKYVAINTYNQTIQQDCCTVVDNQVC